MKLSLSWIEDVLKPQVMGRPISRDFNFSGIGTDTRKSLHGQLFMALKGDKYDAHEFLGKAIQAGACALLVHDLSTVTQEISESVCVLYVPDTLMALQDLSRAHRRRSSAKIIGIAGSNGKTTSKEFTAALLSQFAQTHASQGSFNNHWGVPFTLLAVPAQAQFAVVEMGMNHTGELAVLTRIAEPDISVCTYVGIEHIEFFGSLDKIAEAEGEIYEESPAQSILIFNLDNSYTQKMHAKAQALGRNIRTFSSQSVQADVQIRVKKAEIEGLVIEGLIGGVRGEVRVPVFGQHNVTNLMVAASCALALNLDPQKIWQFLPVCQTAWGRNQWLSSSSGARVLFDAYNANPDSVRALVENLKIIPKSGRRVGVFAEMRELGDQASQWHRSTAQHLVQGDWDELWFYGPSVQDFAQGLRDGLYTGRLFLSDQFDEQIARDLSSRLLPQDVVVLKGSRGMKLERFAEFTGTKLPPKESSP